jgi:hypothetical protein
MACSFEESDDPLKPRLAAAIAADNRQSFTAPRLIRIPPLVQVEPPPRLEASARAESSCSTTILQQKRVLQLPARSLFAIILSCWIFDEEAAQ